MSVDEQTLVPFSIAIAARGLTSFGCWTEEGVDQDKVKMEFGCDEELVNAEKIELEFLKKEGLKLKADGYLMQDMILFVVNSRIFTEK